MAPHEHNIFPRYTCPLFYADCGGGYCCPPAQSCQNGGSGAPTCHLGPPGLLGSDSPAQLAPGASSSTSAAPSSTTSTTPSTSSSTSSAVATATVTSTPTASAAAMTDAGSISGSGIAGIVVGVIILFALIGGSAWSLMRRKKREELREASLLPDGGKSAGSDCLTGFFGGTAGGRVASTSQPQDSPQMQERSPRISQGGVYQPRQSQQGQRPSGGDREDNLVYMYGGSNVGKTQGEVPGRVEVIGDIPVNRPKPVIPRKQIGSQRRGPVYEAEGSPVGPGSA